MPKVKLKAVLKNSDKETIYNIFGTLNEEKNTITYFEEDDLKTKVIFNYEEKRLTRENNNLLMIYSFDKNEKTIGSLKVKELNQIVNLQILTEKLNIKDYDLEVKFKVEEANFLYKIEVEK